MAMAPPLRLYRYFGSHAVETIETEQLKISKPSDFNDPFEFMYEPIFNERTALIGKIFDEQLNNPSAALAVLMRTGEKSLATLRKAMKTRRHLFIRGWIQDLPNLKESLVRQIQIHADRRARIVCLTEASDLKSETLMWSHYARQHAGVRVGFEFPHRPHEYFISPVIYREDRVKLEISDFGSPKFKAALDASMKTKSKIWEYEKEHRLLTVERTTIKRAGMEFIHFQRDWVKRVDLGCRYPANDIPACIARIKTACPHAEIHKAKIPVSGFHLEYEQIA